MARPGISGNKIFSVSRSQLIQLVLIGFSGIALLSTPIALAGHGSGGESSSSSSNNTGSGGTSGSSGTPNTVVTDASNSGIVVGTSADKSTLSNQQTSVQTGANTNTNQVLAPTSSNGGTSALLLPQNPLGINNAALGRSNFAFQVGLNNNPSMSNLLSGSKGGGNAMGWFMQSGVTVPFGKIPDIISNASNNQLDANRQQRMDDDRQVFGSVQPSQPTQAAQTEVQGKVVSLNAYNYSTAATPKIGTLQDTLHDMEANHALNVPKVLALSDAVVYSKPLGIGEKVGGVQVGNEYRYVAHTNSGWVKVGLPDGREGWVKGQFEYLKNDYTEIDTVTLQNTPSHTAHNIENHLQVSSLDSIHNKAHQ